MLSPPVSPLSICFLETTLSFLPPLCLLHWLLLLFQCLNVGAMEGVVIGPLLFIHTASLCDLFQAHGFKYCLYTDGSQM